MSLELETTPAELRARFNALSSSQDVADLLDVRHDRLVYHLYGLPDEAKYARFTLKKAGGGTRIILAPRTSLKIIQSKLAQVLNSVFKPSGASHGYVEDRSIVTNARHHVDRRYVLNVDIEGFFPSIHFGRVRGLFMARPYSRNENVATVLAQICALKDCLPQGAPTSPVISNMICRKLDVQLRDLAKANGCYYTRYADDMTFSTSAKIMPPALAVSDELGRVEAGLQLQQIIEENGFVLNTSKIRLQLRGKHQEVTGLTVNEKVNVDRRFVRQVRAMIHAWEKYGHDAAERDHFEHWSSKYRNPDLPRPKFSEIVKGKLEFVRMVKGPADKTYVALGRRVRKLDAGYHPGPFTPVEDLLLKFTALRGTKNVRSRGYALEDLLNDLLQLSDLKPLRPFRRNKGAEQIDGAFEHSGIHFLVECKWKKEFSDTAELDALYGKVSRSGAGTFGIFLSMKGWSENVPRLLKQNPIKAILLMDMADLEAVLEERVLIEHMIDGKLSGLRYKSEPYVPFSALMA